MGFRFPGLCLRAFGKIVSLGFRVSGFRSFGFKGVGDWELLKGLRG